MRFCIIYINNKAVRDQVIALLLGVINRGINLAEKNTRHHLFMSFPKWPESEVLQVIPLHCQCEEMEFVDGSIRTIRLQTIDVEAFV